MSATTAGRHRGDPQHRVRRAWDWIRTRLGYRLGDAIWAGAKRFERRRAKGVLVVDDLEERAIGGLPEAQDGITEERMAALQADLDPHLYAAFSHAPQVRGDDTNARYWDSVDYRWGSDTHALGREIERLGEEDRRQALKDLAREWDHDYPEVLRSLRLAELSPLGGIDLAVAWDSFRSELAELDRLNGESHAGDELTYPGLIETVRDDMERRVAEALDTLTGAAR